MAAAVRRLVMNPRLCVRHFAQRTRTFRTSTFHSEISKSAKLSVYGAAVATSVYLGIKLWDKNVVVEAAKPSRRPVCYNYFYYFIIGNIKKNRMEMCLHGNNKAFKYVTYILL